MKILLRDTGTVRLMLTVVCCLAFLAIAPPSSAQRTPPRCIYRERNDPNWAITTPTMFNGTGSILFDVMKRGIYVVDTVSWRARQVTEIDDMNSFEYSQFTNRTIGGVTLMQTGNAGTRIWKFDESLRVRPDTLPERFDTVFFFTHFDYAAGSTLYFSVGVWTVTPPIQRPLITFDGGDSWRTITDRFSFVENDGIGGLWTVRNNSQYLSILHPLTMWPDRNEALQTAIGYRTTPGGSLTVPDYKAFYGSDTILWIGADGGKMFLGVAKLGDTTATKLQSFQTSDGRRFGLHPSRSALYNSATRRAYLCDSNGAIHEYRKGQWHTVDAIVGFDPKRVERVYESKHVYYPVSLADGRSGFSILRLTDSLEQEFRQKDYYDGPMLSGPSTSRGFPMIHPDVITTRLGHLGPLVLTLRSGRGYILNSTLADIQELDPVPMLCGIGGIGAMAPLVVSYTGQMVRPESTGVGRLVSTIASGKSTKVNVNFAPGPIRHSTEGLPVPFVNASEILFPGQQVLQFDRNGAFRRILSGQRSTSVLRIDTSRVLIGNGTKIHRWINGTIVDSIDVLPQLSSADSAQPGFLTSMLSTGYGSVVGFVSGLHVLDIETLTARPSRSGGIVRSTDDGTTWKTVALPDRDPFFLGVIRVDSNVIVAAYTTLVRDTARMNLQYAEQQIYESLYTTMQDYHIVRSTNRGITWERVYTQSLNLGFRLIACSGIRMADGRLLMNGPDGVHESTDDGRTWTYHDPRFDEYLEVISLFTNNDATDLYYCTTTGVFKSTSTTSDVHDADTAQHWDESVIAATWTTHTNAWSAAGVTCVWLTNLIGEVQFLESSPTPGVYVARLRNEHGRTFIRQILIVGE